MRGGTDRTWWLTRQGTRVSGAEDGPLGSGVGGEVRAGVTGLGITEGAD